MPETQDPAVLEVVLEDFGNATAIRSIATTLTGTFGTQSYRFVARRGDGSEGDVPPLSSVTFPVQPAQLPLDSLRDEDAWSTEIREALGELDREVRRQGWVRDGRGDHWWSLRYRRSA